MSREYKNINKPSFSLAFYYFYPFIKIPFIKIRVPSINSIYPGLTR